MVLEQLDCSNPKGTKVYKISVCLSTIATQLILARLNQKIDLINRETCLTMSKGVLRLLKVVMRCYLEVVTDGVLDVKHKDLIVMVKTCNCGQKIVSKISGNEDSLNLQ